MISSAPVTTNTVKPLNNRHIGIFLSVLCLEVVRGSGRSESCIEGVVNGCG